MRRSRALVALSPLLAMFALLAACESDNTIGTPSFSLDAGQSDVVFPEASVPDAPDVDAGELEDAGPKGVSITILGASTPVEGVRVLFHDEQGSIVGEQKTGATGRVTVSSAPHMVTAMAVGEGFEESWPWILTYVGVEDGDALVIRVPSGERETGSDKSFSVELPSNYPDAYGYYAYANGGDCFGNGAVTTPSPAPISVSLSPECAVDPSVVLVEAYSENFTSLAYLHAKEIAPPGAAQTVTVSLADEWKPATISTVTVDNLPTEFYSDARLLQLVKTGVHTVGFHSFYPSGESPQEFPFAVAPDFADAHQVSVSVHSSSGNSRTTVDQRTAPASAHTVDFATALGFITDVSVNTETDGRPEISWTTSSELTSADGAALRLSYVPHGDDIEFDIYVQWSVVFPASATKVVIPSLPDDAQAFAPRNDVHVDAMVVVESSLLNGYADVRKLPLSSELPLRSDDQVLPADGTFRHTFYEPEYGQPEPQ